MRINKKNKVLITVFVISILTHFFIQNNSNLISYAWASSLFNIGAIIYASTVILVLTYSFVGNKMLYALTLGSSIAWLIKSI